MTVLKYKKTHKLLYQNYLGQRVYLVSDHNSEEKKYLYRGKLYSNLDGMKTLSNKKYTIDYVRILAKSFVFYYVKNNFIEDYKNFLVELEIPEDLFKMLYSCCLYELSHDFINKVKAGEDNYFVLSEKYYQKYGDIIDFHLLSVLYQYLNHKKDETYYSLSDTNYSILANIDDIEYFINNKHLMFQKFLSHSTDIKIENKNITNFKNMLINIDKYVSEDFITSTLKVDKYKKFNNVIIYFNIDKLDYAKQVFSFLRECGFNIRYKFISYKYGLCLFTQDNIDTIECREESKFCKLDFMNKIVKKEYLYNEKDLVPYNSLITLSTTESFVPYKVNIAQQDFFNIVRKQLDNPNDFICNELQMNESDIGLYFSNEQLDAILSAIYQFKNGKGFIVADETGLGKGRILAGLIRWAILNKLNVIFVTETSQLFSDIYRDIINTNSFDLVPKPFLLHQNAKVINFDDIVIAKNLTKEKQENVLNSKKIPEDYSNIVLTTYSQFNRSNLSKLDFISSIAKNSLLIMDESHNASGDSTTFSNMENILGLAKHVVYSSATFIKDERNLPIYAKAIPFDKKMLSVFNQILDNDFELLRELLCLDLTRKGLFLRREHDQNNADTRIINVENNTVIIDSVNEFSEIMQQMFAMYSIIDNYFNENNLKNKFSWLRFSGEIARLAKNYLILLKTDDLIKMVKESLSQDRKAVIIIESTFESFLKALLEEHINEEEINEEIKITKNKKLKKQPYFNELLNILLNQICPIEMIQVVNNPVLKDMYLNVKYQIEAIHPILASPIDLIKHELNLDNIKVNELSGRTLELINIDDKWEIQNREKQQRTKIVSQFNNGEVDVIIITRAGSTGISLHASKSFKDKRVRDMYELQIASDPLDRIQFLGRVRRKDQVEKPNINTIVTSIPYEKRIVDYQLSKINKINSHISAGNKSIANKSIDDTNVLVSDEGNIVAQEFLLCNPDLCKKIGMSSKQKKEERYAYINAMLKRSILLYCHEQEYLFDVLTMGTKKLRYKLLNNTENPLKWKARLVKELPFWGVKSEFTDLNSKEILVTEWVVDKNKELDLKIIKERVEKYNHLTDDLKEQKSIMKKCIDAIKGKSSFGINKNCRYLLNNLESLHLNSKIEITNPFDNNKYQGIIIEISYPEKDYFYYLTQYLYTIYVPELDEVLYLTLHDLQNDVNYRKINEITFFNNNEIPDYKLILTGNIIFGSWWAKNQKIGKPIVFTNDKNQIEKGILLPNYYLLEDLYIRDLILFNYDQAINFMNNIQNGFIYNEVNKYEESKITIAKADEVYIVSFDSVFHERTDLIDYILSGHLGYYKMVGNRKNYTVDKIKLRIILQNLYKKGVSFFIQNNDKRKEWYNISLKKYL